MIIIGSIISLVGTAIGGLVGIMFKNPSEKALGSLLGFAGGLMLAVVVFDLIPEALTNWNFIYTIIFCILGIIFIAFVDKNMNNEYIDEHKKMAIITALGLMLHNFPEGMIMGCGFAAGTNLGIKMSVVIAIHDIPEGMAVATPLMASKENSFKIFLYTVLTALPTALGAIIGAFMGQVSNNLLGANLSLASGIMLYVVCGEMLPQSNKLWEGVSSTIGVLSGLIFGLIIVYLL
ncbi:ZIP family metal transporter [Clostridium tetani]|nr:ZIP family metal transporter [Clostridium tetani]AVP56177.1 ZIP family metal transporter [Clostridium tetani]KGI37327.1 zinc transporter [Clostridium tetani ATCC 9441]KGI40733.1 zinc transporter [Clostridium tetani]KGI42189.1 zinc transporter [Clostridium tetani]KHO38412.1 zinc transporter [Clostridium tetani]